MNYKFRVFGLTLVALLAMAALSAAGATAGQFHSEVATDSVLKGEQIGTDVLTVNAGTVKCTEVKYSGNQPGATATTTKLTPEYAGCTAFGFVSTTIDSKQCTFEYSGDNSNVVIACPVGEPLTITAFNCQVTVSSQTTSGVTYSNIGSGNERYIHRSEHKQIHYTQHSKSFPGCSSGTRTDGTWIATSTVRCLDTIFSWRACWLA